MAKPKAKIVVREIEQNDRVFYCVMETTNTVVYRLRQIVGKKEIEALIRSGVTVVVKEMK